MAGTDSKSKRNFIPKLDRQYELRGALIGDGVLLSCKICDEIGIIVGVEDDIYVLNGERAIDPCSLFCPSCGLNLPSKYKALAKLHYGPLTESMVGTKDWENEIPH